ncbi:hypothetical protein C8Q76DRAFT_699702 [Earliella scabrosa]|nr:hypothetical protein C8Q76DRAFT_699702 [Earliella scabrosa]
MDPGQTPRQHATTSVPSTRHRHREVGRRAVPPHARSETCVSWNPHPALPHSRNDALIPNLLRSELQSSESICALSPSSPCVAPGTGMAERRPSGKNLVPRSECFCCLFFQWGD